MGHDLGVWVFRGVLTMRSVTFDLSVLSRDHKRRGVVSCAWYELCLGTIDRERLPWLLALKLLLLWQSQRGKLLSFFVERAGSTYPHRAVSYSSLLASLCREFHSCGLVVRAC